ncbi:DUF1569 domain-containing protein [Flagellimonas aquimarina]|uniref:DUF1569 domain-containing protein n=1 Tax=Flagellimonas aquimarina TaxID=2201895 RepID=A0A316L5H1_9FLAO|nr:DUF1569 domain-containing protein [Allomuricauda koreensis]PWL40165.1 DUF1569 domain-containing protein [Allomuricauda koreensis]
MKRISVILLALSVILTVIVLIRNTESGTDFLDEQFSEIVTYIPKRDMFNEKISEVDVAWHLDHSLRTISKVCEALENSNPDEYRLNFSLSRVFVFTTGIIPRGVAQSPKSVMPPKVIVTDSLYLQIEEARENLKKIELLKEKAHFKHPYFNVIDKGQAKRFLKIHTQHHLKIIKDILENR